MRENEGQEAVKQRTQKTGERRICRREGRCGGVNMEEQRIGVKIEGRELTGGG